MSNYSSKYDRRKKSRLKTGASGKHPKLEMDDTGQPDVDEPESISSGEESCLFSKKRMYGGGRRELYPTALKIAAIRMVEAGQTYSIVAADLHVPIGKVAGWWLERETIKDSVKRTYYPDEEYQDNLKDADYEDEKQSIKLAKAKQTVLSKKTVKKEELRSEEDKLWERFGISSPAQQARSMRQPSPSESKYGVTTQADQKTASGNRTPSPQPGPSGIKYSPVPKIKQISNPSTSDDEDYDCDLDADDDDDDDDDNVHFEEQQKVQASRNRRKRGRSPSPKLVLRKRGRPSTKDTTSSKSKKSRRDKSASLNERRSRKNASRSRKPSSTRGRPRKRRTDSSSEDEEDESEFQHVIEQAPPTGILLPDVERIKKDVESVAASMKHEGEEVAESLPQDNTEPATSCSLEPEAEPVAPPIGKKSSDHPNSPEAAHNSREDSPQYRESTSEGSKMASESGDRSGQRRSDPSPSRECEELEECTPSSSKQPANLHHQDGDSARNVNTAADSLSTPPADSSSVGGSRETNLTMTEDAVVQNSPLQRLECPQDTINQNEANTELLPGLPHNAALVSCAPADQLDESARAEEMQTDIAVAALFTDASDNLCQTPSDQDAAQVHSESISQPSSKANSNETSERSLSTNDNATSTVPADGIQSRASGAATRGGYLSVRKGLHFNCTEESVNEGGVSPPRVSPAKLLIKQESYTGTDNNESYSYFKILPKVPFPAVQNPPTPDAERTLCPPGASGDQEPSTMSIISNNAEFSSSGTDTSSTAASSSNIRDGPRSDNGGMNPGQPYPVSGSSLDTAKTTVVSRNIPSTTIISSSGQNQDQHKEFSIITSSSSIHLTSLSSLISSSSTTTGPLTAITGSFAGLGRRDNAAIHDGDSSVGPQSYSDSRAPTRFTTGGDGALTDTTASQHGHSLSNTFEQSDGSQNAAMLLNELTPSGPINAFQNLGPADINSLGDREGDLDLIAEYLDVAAASQRKEQFDKRQIDSVSNTNAVSTAVNSISGPIAVTINSCEPVNATNSNQHCTNISYSNVPTYSNISSENSSEVYSTSNVMSNQTIISTRVATTSEGYPYSQGGYGSICDQDVYRGNPTQSTVGVDNEINVSQHNGHLQGEDDIQVLSSDPIAATEEDDDPEIICETPNNVGSASRGGVEQRVSDSRVNPIRRRRDESSSRNKSSEVIRQTINGVVLPPGVTITITKSTDDEGSSGRSPRKPPRSIDSIRRRSSSPTNYGGANYPVALRPGDQANQEEGNLVDVNDDDSDIQVVGGTYPGGEADSAYSNMPNVVQPVRSVSGPITMRSMRPRVAQPRFGGQQRPQGVRPRLARPGGLIRPQRVRLPNAMVGPGLQPSSNLRVRSGPAARAMRPRPPVVNSNTAVATVQMQPRGSNIMIRGANSGQRRMSGIIQQPRVPFSGAVQRQHGVPFQRRPMAPTVRPSVRGLQRQTAPLARGASVRPARGSPLLRPAGQHGQGFGHGGSPTIYNSRAANMAPSKRFQRPQSAAWAPSPIQHQPSISNTSVEPYNPLNNGYSGDTSQTMFVDQAHQQPFQPAAPAGEQQMASSTTRVTLDLSQNQLQTLKSLGLI